MHVLTPLQQREQDPSRDLNCNGSVSPFRKTLPCALSAGSVTTASLVLPHLRNRAILARFFAPGSFSPGLFCLLPRIRHPLFPKRTQLLRERVTQSPNRNHTEVGRRHSKRQFLKKAPLGDAGVGFVLCLRTLAGEAQAAQKKYPLKEGPKEVTLREGLPDQRRPATSRGKSPRKKSCPSGDVQAAADQ